MFAFFGSFASLASVTLLPVPLSDDPSSDLTAQAHVFLRSRHLFMTWPHCFRSARPTFGEGRFVFDRAGAVI